MKSIIFTLIICFAAATLFAQTDTIKTRHTEGGDADTIIIIKSKKKHKYKFGIGKDVAEVNINNDQKDTTYTASKEPGFSMGLTFTRFDIGLTTLNDNGSFKLSPQNQFLNYRSWRSSSIGFDVLQVSYRFSSTFRIYTSGGFDWLNLRLRERGTILRDQDVLTFVPDDIKYSKNRLSASYLRIPIALDFRTHDDADGRRFHFITGVDMGLLLSSSLLQESDVNGDQKRNGDYHFTKFRYGPFVRVGYGGIGVFARYYVNDMFDDSPAQKGLRNFSFGMSIGW
ncbi:outer membrane beta-barrel protein [Mucilaginibacter gilvus]|uniref:PorT family protein n=1 Tax=Mucilaginibacter gilvus TaxID=2305909 RepID=A0A3S3Z868_9SPHI|nr:outer membrane beta-barrel protein [Mucilaginibacter gilvus]RWY55437.1 PorT family protein [Mucilaginibacter gilvus]